MSLDKAIKYGKEKRKPYRRQQAFDPSCRNHGSCPYCEASRRYNDIMRRKAADEMLDYYRKDGIIR